MSRGQRIRTRRCIQDALILRVETIIAREGDRHEAAAALNVSERCLRDIIGRRACAGLEVAMRVADYFGLSLDETIGFRAP